MLPTRAVLVQELLGRRLAETPKDAQTPSHQLLLRGGYIRQMGQGIYTLLPLAQRIRAKVEQIIREEMNAIGGQEIQMPVVVPAELWIESGRYESVGAELVRFNDRASHPHVLNMTHEEAVVDVVRSHLDSYRQLPLMVYQIQTKFRDEPRSRAGLIRVREFTMKDAYSFHRTQADLEQYYAQCHRAYARIFQRCGLTQVVDIQSDTGMMGGKVAHEFMLVSPHGEDTLLLCDACGFRANREIARSARKYEKDASLAALEKVATPGKQTIEEVAGFLGAKPEQTAKAVLFVGGENRAIIAFVRGDLEVNQAKLRKVARAADLRPMRDDEVQSFGIAAGYVGPIGLAGDKRELYFDHSVAESTNLIIGANEKGFHTKGFSASRDLQGPITAHDIAEVKDGDPCPECGKALRATRGIEVGNIFQLGTKYSESMKFQYTEEDQAQKFPIMGCYGIGVGRTLACVAEEHHDDRGPIWPISVAPFTVQICALQAKQAEVVAEARKLYNALKGMGVEVLLDTREVGAGFMFADADLIAAPIRVIVSPRNLKQQVAELKFRLPKPVDGLPEQIPLAEAVGRIPALIEQLSAYYARTATWLA